jgi:hypothetical protein
MPAEPYTGVGTHITRKSLRDPIQPATKICYEASHFSTRLPTGIVHGDLHYQQLPKPS